MALGFGDVNIYYVSSGADAVATVYKISPEILRAVQVCTANCEHLPQKLPYPATTIWSLVYYSKEESKSDPFKDLKVPLPKICVELNEGEECKPVKPRKPTKEELWRMATLIPTAVTYTGE